MAEDLNVCIIAERSQDSGGTGGEGGSGGEGGIGGTGGVDVTRDTTEIEVSKGSCTRSGSEMNVRWSITTIAPVPDLNLETDRWSISYKINGHTFARVKQCLADSVTGNDLELNQGATISGTYSLLDSDLLSLGIPKTLCFANADWVRKTFGPYVTQNGVLKTAPQGRSKGSRCVHSRLPGNEFLEGTFEVHPMGGASHHSVAKWLADRMGINLVVTTPDIPIIDTFTVSSGTSWIDAVKTNFAMWSPDVRLELDSDSQVTLYILDVLTSAGRVPTTESINIPNAIITGVQHSHNPRGANSKKVDHVIVTGRASGNTTIWDDPDFTPRKIPEISLSPNYETPPIEIPVDDMLAHKEMGEYSGEFGTGEDAFTVKLVKKAIVRNKYYRYYDPQGGVVYILLEENHETIDADGNVLSRIQTERTYGEGYRPIRIIEREFVRTNMPGSSSMELKKLKVKHTNQQYYVKGLNQALTNEFVEELVLADKLQKAGQSYLDNPNSMLSTKRTDRTRTAIDKKNNTVQVAIPMTTKFRRTSIYRTSNEVLEKRDIDIDRITATARANSQVLQNPKPSKQDEKGDIFRREYFYGDPVNVGGYDCYRNTVTIHHDDICTDEVAKAVADRQAYRSEDDIVDVTAKTKIPIPIGVLPCTIVLQPDQKTVQKIKASVPTMSTTSPSDGGTFQLYEVEEQFQTSKDITNQGIAFEQTLKASNRL